MIERKYWPFVLAALLCLSVWKMNQSPIFVNTVPAFYTLNSANSSAFTYPTLPPDDYRQLINLNNFEFLILNKCNKQEMLLLILVHSSPTNFAKRKTIRETWGQNRDSTKIVFMIGSVQNQTVMDEILSENKNFRDIAQGNFIDSYRNMTYKHVMVFKYAIHHCPHAKYILKTDDDVFVNMPRMMDFLILDLSPFGTNNLLFCTPYRNARALRSYRSKWRVNFEEYPDKYYPPYCPGWALLYSPDVLFALYNKVQQSKYFWIDDVLITGMLLKELQIEHTDFHQLTLARQIKNKIIEGYSGNVSTFLYGTPDLTETEIKALWNFVHKSSQNKPVLQSKRR